MNQIDQDELEKIIKNISNKALSMERKLHKVRLTPATEEENTLSNRPQNFEDLEVSLEVLLGRKKLTLKELSTLNEGSLIALEEGDEEKVAIFVNDKKVGMGEIVAIDGHFGVKITNLD